jgi:hypothetical protein
MACTEERTCLINEICCKINDISCRINKYQKIGKKVTHLWNRITKLQNIDWVICNMTCTLTCKEVEKFRCIVKKIKG